MHTMKLRTLQQPSLIESLLDSLSTTQNWAPSGAALVTDRNELTSALQKLAIRAVKGAGAWRAWTNQDGVKFFVAEMSMDLSRERGRPALKVRHYNDQGQLQQYGVWVLLPNDGWQRCAV
jgi:hypothetical protein